MATDSEGSPSPKSSGKRGESSSESRHSAPDSTGIQWRSSTCSQSSGSVGGLWLHRQRLAGSPGAGEPRSAHVEQQYTDSKHTCESISGVPHVAKQAVTVFIQQFDF
mmetsp:Transcript_105232/g.187053  ORF Transcript_105232/g.187053 Transcript_105232/m.187053 type:complete len:107 (+) Transcript_105232:783-1103(+)